MCSIGILCPAMCQYIHSEDLIYDWLFLYYIIDRIIWLLPAQLYTNWSYRNIYYPHDNR